MSERIVVVDQLVKDFAVRGGKDGATLTALDSVSLTVGRGVILGIMGRAAAARARSPRCCCGSSNQPAAR